MYIGIFHLSIYLSLYQFAIYPHPPHIQSLTHTYKSTHTSPRTPGFALYPHPLRAHLVARCIHTLHTSAISQWPWKGTRSTCIPAMALINELRLSVESPPLEAGWVPLQRWSLLNDIINCVFVWSLDSNKRVSERERERERERGQVESCCSDGANRYLHECIHTYVCIHTYIRIS
jgi:hypothetical protein